MLLLFLHHQGPHGTLKEAGQLADHGEWRRHGAAFIARNGRPFAVQGPRQFLLGPAQGFAMMTNLLCQGHAPSSLSIALNYTPVVSEINKKMFV